jgi:hypothetical protein
LSSTVVVVVVVVVAFVVCANTDDGAKVVPMMASAATRLTITRTATNIIIDRFIEQRKRTELIRVPPDDAWKRFCDFIMMIDSRRASGRFYCLPASGGSCYALVRSIRKPEVRIDACAQRRQIARFNAENDVRAGKRNFCPASFVVLEQAF